jgi:hypothetical protein
MRPAIGAINGSLAVKELPCWRTASEVSIALIAISSRVPICPAGSDTMVLLPGQKISNSYISDPEVILTSWGLILRCCRMSPTGPLLARKQFDGHPRQQLAVAMVGQ